MKIKLFSLFCFFYIAVSCNDQNKDTAKETNPGQNEKADCYQYANNTDTIILRIVNVNGAVTGLLIYKFNEKDNNKGTIQGTMKDNILIADYTFLSEGVQSVRQVVFKKVGNDYTEGYGDITVDNNKTVFLNIDSLSFSKSMILSPVNCQ